MDVNKPTIVYDKAIMNKNTIITFLLIIIAVLSFLLFKSKREYNEAQKLITTIRQELGEAKEEVETKTSEIKHSLSETGNKIEKKAEKVKAALRD